MNTPDKPLLANVPGSASNSGDSKTGIMLSEQSPWPGLAAYSESASNFFFGRKEEAAELLRMIRLAPLTVLYGKSGLGKTSLLQAGLYPLLRAEHYFPVHLRLDFAPSALLSPLEQAMQKLQDALTEAGAEFPAPAKDESLWHYLHRRDLEIWSRDNYLLIPVLVFDQFEEIFSQGEKTPDQIEHALNALADLIENRIPSELTIGDASRRALSELALQAQRYRMVLSFREDFLPEIEGWQGRVPSLLRNRLRLLPMSRERAIEAVMAAGAAVLAAGVAEPLVDFVGNLDSTTSGVLPVIEPVLLSLCCYQLNQRRSPDGKIDIALLRQSGQDILQDFYNQALAGMPATVSEFIETHLIQGNRYRSSYPVEQALQDGFLTREQLSLLANKHRLLRIDQQSGINRIELIHDRLVSVVSKARDERLRQTELQRLQAEKEEQRRRMVLETALEKQAAAEALAAERLRATERALADASRLRKQARQLQGALLTVIILFGVAGYGLYHANFEKKERKLAQREALSLRLVSESLDISNGIRPGGDERALLQLLAAKQIAPSNKKVDAALIMTLNRTSNTQKIWNIGIPVSAITFSPDGRRLLSAGDDGVFRGWSIQTDQLLDEPLAMSEKGVISLASSPDGKRLATANAGGTLRVWDIDTGQPIGNKLDGLPSEEPIYSIAFSHDGNQLMTVSKSTFRLWDLRTGESMGESLLGYEGAIRSAALSPDGSLVVWGGEDKTLRLWDVQRKKLMQVLTGHNGAITSVAFSPDGAQLVSGSEDKTLRLWNTRTGQLIGEPMRGHESAVVSVAFSPDGKQIASVSRDATLRLWDASNSQLIDVPLQGHEDMVTSVAFSPDGNRILSASDDKTLRLWDASTGQPIGEPMKGHEGTLNGAVFTPDGARIVSAASDKTLRLWDAIDGKQMGQPWYGHEDGIETVAISPDGMRVASGGKDNTVRVWDAHTGQPIGQPMRGHEEMVRSVAFSPDGAFIVSASYDHTLQRWDANSQQPAGEPMRGHKGPVVNVAYSPDGQYIVSGSKDKTVRLWDAYTGQPVGEPLLGHEARVNSVAFSADSHRIVSGSHDMMLRLWDVNSGLPMGNPMPGHLGWVSSTVFSPDGTRIVSGSADKTVRLWPATVTWSETLCNKLTRNMSQMEWHEWVSPEIKYRKQCPDLPVPEDKILSGGTFQ
ncbi:NACHT domain-containing protein [Nitrosomonas communis]|uniref:WD40 repeat n=1 Tax=Nitrosomonas communis TaxID=44574 RepID=A0A1H2QYB5_9PROT|nr:NACHT domain-containing protein [Nitrosomonas communis]SDW11624.1 WD40 repeat [Nitrosomonas communis]